MTSFFEHCLILIQSIPEGQVSTYGKVASLAGNPRAARQVSYFLSSSSEKYNLPWHRVISSSGKISLRGEFGERQQGMLISEGVELKNQKIDLKKYLWEPSLEEVEDLLGD